MQTYRLKVGSNTYYGYGNTKEEAATQLYFCLSKYYPMSLAAYLNHLEGRVPVRTITDYYQAIKAGTDLSSKLTNELIRHA